MKITKRKDGRWVTSITVEKGKRKQFYSSEVSKQKAEKDIQHQMINYSNKEKNGKTFAEVADEWEKQHFIKLENNSLKAYKPALRSAKEYFNNKNIKDITTADINLYIQGFVKKGLAHKTIKNKLLVVSLIFKFSAVLGYTKQNPCLYVELPKHLPKSVRQMAEEADVAAIKSNIDKPFGLFALFLLVTGCRRGEALALQPSDIDFENNTVKITKTVEWIGNKPQIKNNPKTEAGKREIPLPDFIIPHLTKLSKQKYLFPNSNGELMDNSQVTRLWDKYKKETGINVTPHQLRHTYATILFDAGVDVKTAQKILGHTDIKTTLGIYTHLSESRLSIQKEKLMTYFSNNF